MVSRPLTKGEITLAKSVFGDSVDYSTVTISDVKFGGLEFLPEGTAMAPNGKLFMPGCYKDDYSKESVMQQSLFIHEMTHVWQFQNKILAPIVEAAKLNLKHGFNYMAAYGYTLDGKKDLLDYNMEQQASIVQDNFILKHAPEMIVWGNCNNKDCNADLSKLFDKTLAKFHADPGYAKQDAFPSVLGLKKKPSKPAKP